MSSSVDDLDDLMKGLSMGGRRRTRRNKGKGKKRGGNDHADTIARCREEVKELEEAVDRLRRQRRGGTRKTRKTRRGGVEQTPEELAVKKLRAELDDLEKDPSATPEQIAKKRNEFVKALDKERFILRGQRM
jgi:NTP pyrophosphatase (non-canonical NTP hydrolase)